MGKELDFDKLRGSQNFHTWAFAMKNFLAIKGMSNCIRHKPASGSPLVEHAPEIAVENDANKISSANAYLVLGVETSIYVHIQKCTTALDTWNTLHRMYEEKGLSRKISLLGELLSNKLCDCDGMQDYVDRIATAANKLTGVGFDVSDEWLGAILLAGLTENYGPFIMGLESTGVTISSDTIISKLIDSQIGGDKNSAFFGKKKKNFPKGKRQRKCYNCDSLLHLANNCDKPKKNTSNSNDKNSKTAKVA